MHAQYPPTNELFSDQFFDTALAAQVFLGLDFSYPPALLTFSAPLGFAAGFAFDVLGGYASPACLGFGTMPFTIVWFCKTVGPLLVILPFIALNQYASAKQQASAAAHVKKARKKRKTWVSRVGGDEGEDEQGGHVKEKRADILSLDEYDLNRQMQLLRTKSVKTILVVSMLVLVFGVSSCASVWYCPDAPPDGDGMRRLPADPTVECTFANDDYRTLFSTSLVVFLLYVLGTSGFLFLVIESDRGRIAAFDHHVTHARLVGGLTALGQLRFLWRLLLGGQRFGRRAEKDRVLRRLHAVVTAHGATGALKQYRPPSLFNHLSVGEGAVYVWAEMRRFLTAEGAAGAVSLFTAEDMDHTGHVDEKGFGHVLQAMGVKHVPKKVVAQALKKAPRGFKGKIVYGEVVKMLERDAAAMATAAPTGNTKKKKRAKSGGGTSSSGNGAREKSAVRGTRMDSGNGREAAAQEESAALDIDALKRKVEEARRMEREVAERVARKFDRRHGFKQRRAPPSKFSDACPVFVEVPTTNAKANANANANAIANANATNSMTIAGGKEEVDLEKGSTELVEGIFQRRDKETGKLLVATGRGDAVDWRLYDFATTNFEDGRRVAVTSDILEWGTYVLPKKPCNSSTATILAPIALFHQECCVYYLPSWHGHLHCF